jgi:hypothetical protein
MGTAMTAMSLLSGFSKLSRSSTHQGRAGGAGHFKAGNVEQQLVTANSCRVLTVLLTRQAGKTSNFRPWRRKANTSRFSALACISDVILNLFLSPQTQPINWYVQGLLDTSSQLSTPRAQVGDPDK